MLKCVISMGDIAGIGPEVTLKALADKKISQLANFVIIGNAKALDKTARLCKIKLRIKKIDSIEKLDFCGNRSVNVLDVASTSRLVFGKANSSYGHLAMQCIEKALHLLKTKDVDALITAPVNKYAISKAGFDFCGHTEYLARATKTKNFAMMLIGGPLKVVLATRHIAIEKVARELKTQDLSRTLSLTAKALKRYFSNSNPKIAVCALNPHSGESGLMGDQEKRVIQPAIAKVRHSGKFIGPLPADTVFHLALKGEFDAVVAMYHDQGLIPLKMIAFNQGVNLTLGLNFVRTSPDHGTAYEIAGKNKADPGSMIEAIKLAVKLAKKTKKGS